MPLTVPVILGTVRTERVGPRVARYLIRELERRGHRPVPVDPLEYGLPLLDKMYKEYPAGTAPEPLERLAGVVRSADAYLVVSAEYNHSVPPALSNLLDHFLEEYFFKPSAIACYSPGRYGGVRAAMQLRSMLAEMGMPSIPSLLPFPKVTEALAEDGTPTDDGLAKPTGKFLDEFVWYAEALKAARAGGVPY